MTTVAAPAPQPSTDAVDAPPTIPPTVPATPAAPATTAPSPPPVDPALPCPVGGTNVIREGDGATTPCPDVRVVQENLNDLGFPVVVDGRFGPSTTAAVKDFQRVNGLEVDGLVGRITWGLLVEAGECCDY